ncbi:hypothetical protein PVAR5_8381 [Paecilomyces variotii No. 5]|uniref:Uncharacterized protein n=1 Tax=Byssochlamys spectabilis (strain No. 5 / NBRC 109023) TaxID=1356009 RepID=V5FNQ2_BYSSN|nr:hypothetical protein PVAR5_8381 [Paecilomyces variotii No. 5]
MLLFAVSVKSLRKALLKSGSWALHPTFFIQKGIVTESELFLIMQKGSTADEKQRLFRLATTAKDDHDLPAATRNTVAWSEHLLFGLHLIPLALGILLIFSDVRNWHMPNYLYELVDRYRTSVQTVVQVLAAMLAAIEVFIICRLINLATRIWFTRATISLDVLGFWSALSTPANNWNLPLWMIVITILFCNLSAVISALWTGALTPTNTTGVQNATILIPDWSNLSYIREYPSEIDQTGLTIRDTKGFFTYSVGVGMLTSLLSSANSASPVDGGTRNHSKLDNTGYSYHGRSYGVGASVGLLDSSVLNTPRAVNYSYDEVGLDASVSCIYNDSSLFFIGDTFDTNLYAARGPLPDSAPGSPEYSVYVGRGSKSIVAIGVAAVPTAFTATRYMAVTAGQYYSILNATQCAVTFTPARFNVSVDIKGRNITVSKAPSASPPPSIDPHHNMTHVVMRQLELISNDLTGYYRSILGDTLNASISDYRTSLMDTKRNSTQALSGPEVVLRGLENAVTSLVDDILVAYASAQLMVGHFTDFVPAQVQVSALRVGSRGYIIASAAITGVITLLVIGEAIRVRGWRGLPEFDYLDNQMLVVSASRGGKWIADYADQVECKNLGAIPVVWKAYNDVGDSGEVTLGTF